MNVCDVSFLKEIVSKYGFSFEKSFGQNFLIDPAAAARTVAAAGAAGADAFEIGPGAGALTLGLFEAARSVTVLELDRRLEPVLARTLPPEVRVIWGDILSFPLESLPPSENRVAVSNLPYNVTTKALTRLLSCGLFTKITVTIQKEAARKLAGSEGRSKLTLLAEHWSAPRVLFTLPAGCFYPRPKVDSAVMTFDVKPRRMTAEQEEGFLRTADALYASRRKTLRNVLSAEFGRERAERALELSGLDPGARGEELSAGQAERLSLALM